MFSRTRRLSCLRAALAAAVLAFAAPSSFAQTNDHIWRSWSWQEDVASPRVAGLAGASVALGDDASDVFTNPAGIGFLPKTEIAASILMRGSGRLALGDRTTSRTGIGFIGGAGRVTPRLAIGAFVTEPHDERISLAAGGSPAGDSGYLDTTVTDAGVAVAWNPTAPVSIGLRLNVSHLRVQGLLNHSSPGAAYDSGAAGAQDRIAGDAGVLVRLSDKLSAGLAFTQGARWEVSRTEGTTSFGVVDAAPYQVSSPSRLALGVAVRPSPRLTLVGQADYLLLSRLEETFQAVTAAGARADYILHDAFDYRAGVEYSVPIGTTSLQLRGGVLSRAPGAFRFVGTGAEAAAFAGEQRQTLATVGGSIVLRTLRLHVAAALGGDRTVAAAGAAVRF